MPCFEKVDTRHSSDTSQYWANKKGGVMTQRYLGWRAGALAVVGCALGALLASPSAQAQTCVGDCNEDGQVLINELIIGVNIALDSQPVSACPSFDANNNGQVAIN